MKIGLGLGTLAALLAGMLLMWQGATGAGVKLPPAETIDQLTQQQRVVGYVRQHQRLPDYYIGKKQAREIGWNAREGDLCRVLPGRAIGGDRFSNRERRLPNARGRIWREADINYRCGHRGAERLLYSSDGLIYLTHDHYKNFQRVE